MPKNSRLVCLPFLPVNPDYGTTRNQGRQKLARLDAREFAVLVRDVLKVRLRVPKSKCMIRVVYLCCMKEVMEL